MSAACSCSNGNCRRDREVADVELHVELAELVERMRTEVRRDTLYV
jgi:hypothetical protein